MILFQAHRRFLDLLSIFWACFLPLLKHLPSASSNSANEQMEEGREGGGNGAGKELIYPSRRTAQPPSERSLPSPSFKIVSGLAIWPSSTRLPSFSPSHFKPFCAWELLRKLILHSLGCHNFPTPPFPQPCTSVDIPASLSVSQLSKS